MHPGPEDLPVELLYTVQLHALSDTLPHASRHLYRVFKSAPPSLHAEYILGRLPLPMDTDTLMTTALRYPLCTVEVLKALCRQVGAAPSQDLVLKLPQRFFRDLPCRGSEWTEHDYPLPFLKYLSNHFSIFVRVEYHSYALKNATQACFLPLISFLLGRWTTEKRPLLLWAVMEGHEAVTELSLAQDNIDVNSKGADDRTPLSYAADRGFEQVVKLLLARDNIDVNSKDIHGWTPLFWAAYRGHEGVIKLLLLRDDTEVNLKDRAGWTPLCFAGSQRQVELLLARDDIDVNSQDRHGWTPLFWAVYRGHKGVIKLLLQRDDIDVTLKDVEGNTLLSWAGRWHTSKEALTLLLARDDIERNSNQARAPLNVCLQAL